MGGGYTKTPKMRKDRGNIGLEGIRLFGKHGKIKKSI
jgi:hypothetical protein